MIPTHLQPIIDRIGLTFTGLAAYLNVKLGFLNGHFLFSPTFNTMLTIIISLLSIAWIIMKIYDQYLVTKQRKDEMKLYDKYVNKKQK